MRSRLAAGFACFFGFAALPPVLAEDWPHWRGPAYDGRTREKLPANLDTAEVEWTVQVGIGFSSVAVVGDRILTMGNADDKDTVWCLDARTGKPLWRHCYACALDPLYYEGGPGGTPTVDVAAKAVYTLSKKGHAYCLDLEKGTVRWERDLLKDHGLELPEWSFAGSPLVVEGRVLLNVGSAGWALDAKTGKTLWESGTTRSGYSTPLPVGPENRDVAIFSAKELVVVAAKSGEISWRHAWKSSRDVNAADPLAVGDRLLISSSVGAALLRPREEGAEVLWQNKNLRCYFNPGVHHDGHVYAIHGTTHGPTELVCLRVEDGEVVWSEGGFGSGGLVAADGGQKLIVFDKGQLTILPATKGGFEPLLRMQVLGGKCWTAPVLANGAIYCRNAAGKVACVRFGPQP